MGSAPRAILQAGVALLAMYVVILLSVLWPVQLLVPAFQLRLGAQLINSGPIALLGLALMQLGCALDPGDRWLAGLHRRAAALAVAAVFGFLMLIPLLGVASLRQQQSQSLAASAQLRRADAQLQAFRQALAASTSPADLEARFTALKGPRFDALDRTLPMPQLRLRAAALLDQLAVELKRRRSRLPSADPWKTFPEILLTALGGLVLAAGFAALARRPGQTVSLLEEPLLLWALWDDRQQLERDAEESRHGRSASPVEDYIRQLSGEQDEPPRD